MSKLKRFNPDGHPCFVTNITFRRKPLLVANADLILKSFSNIRRRTPFELIAWVIMPDHFHFIVNLRDEGLSSLVQRIKMSFGSLLRKRLDLQSGRIWQNGFWDHIIRDDHDMKRRMDYIHFNPMKHGYVESPFEWHHSSIHEYCEDYPPEWGQIDLMNFSEEYGE
jgi:putative transposase